MHVSAVIKEEKKFDRHRQEHCSKAVAVATGGTWTLGCPRCLVAFIMIVSLVVWRVSSVQAQYSETYEQPGSVLRFVSNQRLAEPGQTRLVKRRGEVFEPEEDGGRIQPLVYHSERVNVLDKEGRWVKQIATKSIERLTWSPLMASSPYLRNSACVNGLWARASMTSSSVPPSSISITTSAAQRHNR